MSALVQGVAAAGESFRSLLEAHRWAPSSLSARRQASNSAAAAAAAADGSGDAATPTAAAAAAAAPGVLPQSLVEHVPLAVYANGLLAAFNELRHCAPLSLRAPAAAALQESLGGVSSGLAHYGLTRALGEVEAGAFDAACRAHTATLCPYVAACFERIYAGGAVLIDVRAVGQPLADMAAQKEGAS